MEKMPVLIYMESAYRKSDGSGAVRCEVMLPGDGQTTISMRMDAPRGTSLLTARPA